LFKPNKKNYNGISLIILGIYQNILYLCGMKTKIHVNQHNIRSNKTKGTDLPVITVKRGRTNTYGHEVEILGPSRIIYGGSGCDAKA